MLLRGLFATNTVSMLRVIYSVDALEITCIRVSVCVELKPCGQRTSRSFCYFAAFEKGAK